VHAEKALCGSSRLEPLQLAFASSHRLMRVLRSIVLFIIRGHRRHPLEPAGARHGSRSTGSPEFLAVGQRSGTESLQTHRWSKRDSNPRSLSSEWLFCLDRIQELKDVGTRRRDPLSAPPDGRARTDQTPTPVPFDRSDSQQFTWIYVTSLWPACGRGK